MACFIIPMVLAIVLSAAQRVLKGIAERLKLWILNVMLWGGVVLLAVEHIWHGEIAPWPPFLTAMTNPSSTLIMLHEMATIGTAMTVGTIAAWGAILAVSHYIQRIPVKGSGQPRKALIAKL